MAAAADSLRRLRVFHDRKEYGETPVLEPVPVPVYELEVDLAEGFELLQLQILSVTGVPPEEQHLFGLGPGLAGTDVDLMALGLEADAEVALWTPAAKSLAISPARPEVVMYQEACDAGRLQAICRAFPGINLESVNQIVGQLMAYSRKGLQYEDPAGKRAALAVIPVAKLVARATRSGPKDRSYEDAVLYELLKWFKKEFFSWVNQPPCSSCNGRTRGVGGLQPTAAEIADGARNIEAYQCEACGAVTRFPRYNSPVKLLVTRKGRCGEWANCFTLCCRAMGFDARLVLDWTDHVWTEVWSEAGQSWWHMDSCEIAFNAPLMYESGWGKKLSYVFAFSGEEVVDVIHRYTRKIDEVRSRRTLVPEPWLEQIVQVFDAAQRIKLGVSDERARIVRRHKAAEVRQLQSCIAFDSGQRSAAELQGRISGSLEWRASRAELGTGVSESKAAGSTSPVTSGGWRPVCKLPAIRCATAFNGQLVVLLEEGALGWAKTTALESTPSTDVAVFKPLQVQATDGSPWACSAVVSLAAVYSRIAILVITADAQLFELVPHASAPKTWVATCLGSVPPAASSIAVVHEQVLILADQKLWAAPLGSVAFVAVGEAQQLQCIAASSSHVLLAIGANSLMQLLPKAARSPGPQPTWQPAAAVSSTVADVHFTMPSCWTIGTELTIEVQLNEGAPAATIEDWLLLCSVHQQAMATNGAGILLEDAVECSNQPETTLPTLRRFTLTVPPGQCPKAPGIYEARLFTGSGYSRVRAHSHAMVAVSPPAAKLRVEPLEGSTVSQEAVCSYNADGTVAVGCGRLVAEPGAPAITGIDLRPPSAGAEAALRLSKHGASACQVAVHLSHELGSPAVSSVAVWDQNPLDCVQVTSLAGATSLTQTKPCRLSLPSGFSLASGSQVLPALGEIRVGDGDITASGNNDAESCDKLLDGKVNTKWLDFGAAGSGEAWVMFRVGAAACPSGICVSHYGLTSGNDCPPRDPASWELQASNDGTVWTIIDSRRDVVFGSRGECQFFQVPAAQQGRFHYYRLFIRGLRELSAANSVQLAQWRLLYPLTQFLGDAPASAIAAGGFGLMYRLGCAGRPWASVCPIETAQWLAVGGQAAFVASAEHVLWRLDMPSSVALAASDVQPPPPVNAAVALPRLLQQLTKGCGKAGCTNEYCASNPGTHPMGPKPAALLAMKLLKTGHAPLCE